jgi:transcription elongation factor GreB
MTERKNYITKQGYQRLKDELDFLVKVDRPKVVADVSWAASNGDRSENGDYIYGKKRLRQIDARAKFLFGRIDEAVVIESDDSEHYYRIVGQDEIDTEKGFISWVSPIAKALLGKNLEDEVKVETPGGLVKFRIIDVAYHE